MPETISFDELKIVQGQGENAADTPIDFESETIAVSDNINSTEIYQSDFV